MEVFSSLGDSMISQVLVLPLGGLSLVQGISSDSMGAAGKGIHSLGKGIQNLGKGIHSLGKGIQNLGKGIQSLGKGSRAWEGDPEFGKGIHSLERGSTIWERGSSAWERDPEFGKGIHNLERGSTAWESDPQSGSKVGGKFRLQGWTEVGTSQLLPLHPEMGCPAQPENKGKRELLLSDLAQNHPNSSLHSWTSPLGPAAAAFTPRVLNAQKEKIKTE